MQKFDQELIDQAVSGMSRLPGVGSDPTRRHALRSMVAGALAGVLAPTAASLLERPAHAQALAGQFPQGEQVIVCYFSGQGTFSDDVRYITLNMTMYDLNGKEIGTQHGVHESMSSPFELFSVPQSPQEPFNGPPVPIQAVTEWTKGIWGFNDGGAVYAVGPARSRIIPLTDGSWMFTVTTSQTITGGLGKYAKASGVKQATGSAFVPASLVSSGHFPAPGLQFVAHTIEVFRILVPQA